MNAQEVEKNAEPRAGEVEHTMHKATAVAVEHAQQNDDYEQYVDQVNHLTNSERSLHRSIYGSV
jgi:thiaminase